MSAEFPRPWPFQLNSSRFQNVFCCPTRASAILSSCGTRSCARVRPESFIEWLWTGVGAFDTAEGLSRDVTDDIADELRNRCAERGEVPSSLQDFDRVAFFLVSRPLVNIAIGLFCPEDADRDVYIVLDDFVARPGLARTDADRGTLIRHLLEGQF